MTPDQNRMREAYIGLGSNLGDRERFLTDAVRRLNEHASVRVTRCSSIYETSPVGYVEQPAFLNMAVAVETSLTPEQLLVVQLGIEQRLGRTRTVRWGPRTIDLDMLLYDRLERHSPNLELPHPRMFERAFVLIPLLEIMHSNSMSVIESIKASLEKLDEKDEVKLWKRINWPSESELFVN